MVVIDNASMHHSREFERHLNRWAACGVWLRFLPPYCPELNLIEILWKKIKYEWLSFDAYQNYQTFQTALTDILDNVGKKFLITFA